VNRQVVLRLLDTFFRHFWLYLLPVVALGAVGVWAATSTQDSYQSFGTMRIETNALVGELTGIQSDPGFGWLTPAAATSEAFNALLRTETFVDDVASAARLEEAIENGTITTAEIRGSLAIYPDGARLVKVQASNRQPDVTYRLANAAMAAYIRAVVENEASDSRVAVEFLQQKLPDYRAAVAAAEKAFRTWLAEHPPPEDGSERPEDELVEVGRLQGAIDSRQLRLTEAQQNIEQAELAVEQSSAEVEQRLQVIDPPQEPTAPQPKMKKAVMTVAMALVVGCFLAVAGVVIGTILDRTIRFPGDVKERLGVRMLAVVPRTRLTPAMRKRLETPDEKLPAVVPVPSEVAEVTSVTEAATVTTAEAVAPAHPVAVGLLAENGAQETPPDDGDPESPQPPANSLAAFTLKRVP
jgi:uncharacterized protein involved in exopolysaccharide biosynthesis